MIDILNLAIPCFGLIFIGFACGRAKGLPETGLAWMNFFLLYVSLPALLFGIMSKTPFEELNNPPFLVATTLGTMCAFALALLSGRIIGRLWQYRLFGPWPGIGRARREGRSADRSDLLLRQHLSVFDRAAPDRAD